MKKTTIKEPQYPIFIVLKQSFLYPSPPVILYISLETFLARLQILFS